MGHEIHKIGIIAVSVSNAGPSSLKVNFDFMFIFMAFYDILHKAVYSDWQVIFLFRPRNEDPYCLSEKLPDSFGMHVNKSVIS